MNLLGFLFLVFVYFVYTDDIEWKKYLKYLSAVPYKNNADRKSVV